MSVCLCVISRCSTEMTGRIELVFLQRLPVRRWHSSNVTLLQGNSNVCFVHSREIASYCLKIAVFLPHVYCRTLSSLSKCDFRLCDKLQSKMFYRSVFVTFEELIASTSYVCRFHCSGNRSTFGEVREKACNGVLFLPRDAMLAQHVLSQVGVLPKRLTWEHTNNA